MLGSRGRKAEFLPDSSELSQWKHVRALHCLNKSFIFSHESICDGDSCSLGPHKKMECPFLATSGFIVTAIYTAEYFRYAAFLGKWDLLTVNIIHNRNKSALDIIDSSSKPSASIPGSFQATPMK